MIIAPVLKTARLTLRPFTVSDAPEVFLWCSSQECTKYLFWLPHRKLEDSERLVSRWVKKRRNCSWALDLNGEAIGELEIIKKLPDSGFMLGYILREDKQGQGFMSEALAKVLSYMKENGFAYAFAETDERNEKSRHLLEKSGFMQVGEEKGRLIAKKNISVNIVQYRLDLHNLQSK